MKIWVYVVLLAILLTACGSPTAIPGGNYIYVPAGPQSPVISTSGGGYDIGPLTKGQWALFWGTGGELDGVEVGKGDKCFVALYKGPAQKHTVQGLPFALVYLAEVEDSSQYSGASPDNLAAEWVNIESKNGDCKGGIDYWEITE